MAILELTVRFKSRGSDHGADCLVIKEFLLAEILTTKEVAEYLNLHQFTVCRYAANDLIPAIRIGKVWRFDKEAIDEWICSTQKKHKIVDKSRRKISILTVTSPG